MREGVVMIDPEVLEEEEALPGEGEEASRLEEIEALGLSARFPLEELIAAAREPGRLEVTGLHGGALALALSELERRTQRPVVIVTATDKEAQRLAQDLAFFVQGASAQDVLVLPSAAVSPYGDISPDRQVTQARMAALYRLHLGIGGRFVVLSAAAALRRTVPGDALMAYAETLFVGAGDASNERLRHLLASGGYTAVPLVEDPGTFAIRGDIIDLWTPYDDAPVRIERWGDEVTSIKAFDPRSQRTKEEREVTHLFPVREDLLTDETVACAREKLLALADTQHLPSKAVRQIIADLSAGIRFLGIEGLLPALYPGLVSPLELLPEEALLCLVEPDAVQEAMASLLTRRAEEHAARQGDTSAFLFPVEAHYLPAAEATAWLDARPRQLRFGRVGVLEEAGEEAPGRLTFRVQPNQDIIRLRKERQGAEGAVQGIAKLLDTWRQRFGRIVFACGSAGEAQRLRELLESYSVAVERAKGPVDPAAIQAPPAVSVQVVVGRLSEGFRTPALSLAVITDAEVLGPRRKVDQRERSFLETASITSFKDLEVGDTVVHVDFGIGRYGGLHRLMVGGVPTDFLLLEYSGNDKLYLPIYRLGRVQKYVGGEAVGRLDKLGGTGWEKVKERVKGQLKELAGDLIALYARRQIQQGTSFPAPDIYFREFEAAFPFEETPDQLAAIEAVLDDMRRPQIMDRLICGDVGFGKTEVAMRAAFLAVEAGKQVAVLVPTTVLCEQHMRSFRKRMDGYPLRVESLSRFRSKKESDAILADAHEGKVDILIGTHRLLGKEVGFRDLGLLIIDEEQRFGVAHKERLKEFKANVDALTMSATPIPRTLHMAMTGLREMSIIATPPAGRLAVRTHIARFNDAVIREAILREIQRGGQAYFVHNRVETIDATAAKLREIVPEARFAIGHGQMKEQDLEKVMLGFVQGDFNVLVCTSIIESGLDISNANTMLIDRADTFGLAQLYQLRGRIGRSPQRAYCYLLVPSGRKISDDAQKRLEVIERFTELGSGFHVASYDLEMRGAGNLLGAEQSGSINAVGLDLYTELLEEAIAEVRGEEVLSEVEPEVNVPIAALLPEAYIGDVSLRLLFYKRLSLARTEVELSDLYTELNDRFGEPPQEVQNLREIILIKIAMRRLRVLRLDAGAAAVQVHLDERPVITGPQLVALIQAFRGRYKPGQDRKLIRTLAPHEASNPLAAARVVCRELLQAAGLE